MSLLDLTLRQLVTLANEPAGPDARDDDIADLEAVVTSLRTDLARARSDLAACRRGHESPESVASAVLSILYLKPWLTPAAKGDIRKAVMEALS